MNNIIISGFNVHDNNRGTAALSYGAVTFLKSKGLLTFGQKLINFQFYLNPFKKANRGTVSELINIDGVDWEHITYHIPLYEKYLYLKFGLLLPFFKLQRLLKTIDLVAAINGGDGFSDIYGDKTFRMRLKESELALKYGIKHIILPQTIGPFSKEENLQTALEIIRKSFAVYVRDKQFTKVLDEHGLVYNLTADLSYYMNPQPWDISIPNNSIGINISGLAYSNNFRNLSGQFTHYPELIKSVIEKFSSQGHQIYLIPHSYNYNTPEPYNDDLVACKEVYNSLIHKEKIVLVSYDLTSPQVKYLISKMRFFIGTRMHANFAAIFTGVPVFGLAYSYKFEGAFNENGIFNRTAVINNILPNDIPTILDQIYKSYIEDIPQSTI